MWGSLVKTSISLQKYFDISCVYLRSVVIQVLKSYKNEVMQTLLKVGSTLPFLVSALLVSLYSSEGYLWAHTCLRCLFKKYRRHWASPCCCSTQAFLSFFLSCAQINDLMLPKLWVKIAASAFLHCGYAASIQETCVSVYLTQAGLKGQCILNCNKVFVCLTFF